MLQQKSVRRAYDLIAELSALTESVRKARDTAAPKNRAKLEELYSTLVATREGGWLSGEEQLRERLAFLYGAINSYERKLRYGHYFQFFWRATRPTDLTVRFEYRQQNLGAFVQAKEFFYRAAKGSYKSEFQVIGDDYLDDGKVSGWRALLIENGRIVGLTQSFLWN